MRNVKSGAAAAPPLSAIFLTVFDTAVPDPLRHGMTRTRGSIKPLRGSLFENQSRCAYLYRNDITARRLQSFHGLNTLPAYPVVMPFSAAQLIA